MLALLKSTPCGHRIHYTIVFELIYGCVVYLTLQNWLQMNYRIVSVAMVKCRFAKWHLFRAGRGMRNGFSWWILTMSCEPSDPLQHSKASRTSKISQMYPHDCLSGLQSGRKKHLANLEYSWDPLLRALGNFCKNLGFGMFLNAVRGWRARKLGAAGNT